jgi:hypothetical protein
MIEISNPGWLPVRGTDFPAPLAFTFPARQVLAASIAPEATNRKGTGAAGQPAIYLPPQASQGDSPGDSAATRVRLVGDFELRPKDGYIITVVLTGTTATPGHPVHHEGTLANGRIITCQQP